MRVRTVLDEAEVSRAVSRIAHEIVEANKGAEGLRILGIPTRGVPLARRLAERIADIEPGVAADDIAGSLDITMYRDDLRRGRLRAPEPTRIPAAGVDGTTVVLVDDVLFSGRTVRAALDSLADIGRPDTVRLAVLVDRGHRALPIRADHVGKNLPTAIDERVSVALREVDGSDTVTIASADTDDEGEARA
ncbi:bifunctional pyr operon transcriptional regulator/uracil phosphoribosyltransferase PyrR [Brevibacterium sp. 5221]|uniref:Bifunctional protein PyrR n=1 Tax=Brevibacterium rongguiense TaxID=2695267 RepID=A0A6N9H984_9MICO|nr:MULTISPECIES: bifunctional pyr operon transcriptional regulator/uracil phosphoribosyltransferase PyrR [Brevibacterium]MYM20062.1 bifunctional pyr operon transcriptional regulator/uracil phosphoribosyltransferase PyrR [Brevibacterium rongguiense]WAL40905.1 bifunctional pyr operon transcriptional regulator/uracil phosphoribosyltransferase PyrR [Brevibacterium sp. BRM-1]